MDDPSAPIVALAHPTTPRIDPGRLVLIYDHMDRVYRVAQPGYGLVVQVAEKTIARLPRAYQRDAIASKAAEVAEADEHLLEPMILDTSEIDDDDE